MFYLLEGQVEQQFQVLLYALLFYLMSYDCPLIFYTYLKILPLVSQYVYKPFI